MSLIGKRQAFADALDTVAGVQGYPYRPGEPRPGDAWPQWTGGAVDEPSGNLMNGWTVAVMLPQDERAADEWIDARAQLIGDALETQQVAYVEGIMPGNLGQNGSMVYGLLITTRSE